MKERDNSGILFRNDRKSGDRDPDYRGTATINGSEFKMSAWLKKGKNGTFMSFAFTPDDAPKSTTAKSAKAKAASNLDRPF